MTQAPESTVRIVPGQWRPHYQAEQIAWVGPPFADQEYVWLDFPEAIFCGGRLLYLSHLSAMFRAEFEDIPKVPWQVRPDGVAFERTLPNGLSFGGGLTRRGRTAVDMELHMANGTPEPLTDIMLQTCAFLRGVREFADYTNDNKFVHLVGGGWAPLSRAMEAKEDSGTYRIGWRSGPKAADLPVIVAVSNTAPRLVAMTWGEHTYSLVGNPNHPCMHADPRFPDLAPGESATIRGELVFFEGTLDEFEEDMP